MNSKIEKLENSVVKFTLVIPPQRFEEGMKYSYNKNKGSISLPGFRKGKVPRAIVERQFGKGFLMDDAIDFIFPDAFKEAVLQHELSPVSRPEVESLDLDDEEGLTLIIKVTVSPEVTLGEYKGITYNKDKIEVSDEEINVEMNSEREKNARVISITDSPCESGDTAIIDFEGFVDGVPFPGGKGEDYSLELGSHSFVDTFEDQLIGKHAGDDVRVSVTFPENYHDENLSGKPAEFNVTIREVSRKELPALDDDFAQDVSEFDTLEEYKSSVRDKLYHQKEHKREHEIENELIEKVVEGASVDIPEVMIERHMEQTIADFNRHLNMQGMMLDTFLKYSGQTEEEFRKGHEEAAKRNVKARLCLREIAKAEGLIPTGEEIEEELSRIAGAYGLETEQIRQTLHDEDLKGLETDLKTQKALKFIVENAVAINTNE